MSRLSKEVGVTLMDCVERAAYDPLPIPHYIPSDHNTFPLTQGIFCQVDKIDLSSLDIFFRIVEGADRRLKLPVNGYHASKLRCCGLSNLDFTSGLLRLL